MNKTAKVALLSSVYDEKTRISLGLEGTLTAETPISISTSSQINPNDEGVIMHDIMFSGTKISAPVILGGTIKGMIRRRAAEEVIDVLRNWQALDGDESSYLPNFSARDYYRLAIGGVKASSKEKPYDVAKIHRIMDRNPIFALFGIAEPQWITGMLTFGWAYPTDPDCTFRPPEGSRNDDFRREPEKLDLLSPEGQQQWMSLVETTKKTSLQRNDAKTIKRELAVLKNKATKNAEDQLQIDTLNEQLKDLNKTIKDDKQKEIVGETVNRILGRKRAIIPGAVFTHRIDGNRLTLLQLGFLLATLDRVAMSPTIGQMKSVGYGSFKLDYDMNVRIDRNRQKENIGRITIDRSGLTIPDHPLLVAASEAWQKAIVERTVSFTETDD